MKIPSFGATIRPYYPPEEGIILIGLGTIINAGAIVDHDAALGRGVHVAPGGIVKAVAEVAEYAKVDSGEVVRSPWEGR